MLCRGSGPNQSPVSPGTKLRIAQLSVRAATEFCRFCRWRPSVTSLPLYSSCSLLYWASVRIPHSIRWLRASNGLRHAPGLASHFSSCVRSSHCYNGISDHTLWHHSFFRLVPLYSAPAVLSRFHPCAVRHCSAGRVAKDSISSGADCEQALFGRYGFGSGKGGKFSGLSAQQPEIAGESFTSRTQPRPSSFALFTVEYHANIYSMATVLSFTALPSTECSLLLLVTVHG